METRELRYFVAVAEELHFGRAAERLGIAQPPLSRAIRQLERRLGTTLLERTTRAVHLTEAGQVLLREARAALDAVARAEQRTRRAAAADGAPAVVLAAKASASGVLLARLLDAHATEHDGVRVDVELCDPGEAERLVREGVADVAVLHLPYDSTDGLDAEDVRTEPQVAVLPAGHPLAARDDLTLADLADVPELPPARWRRRDGTYPPGRGPQVRSHTQQLQLVALGRTFMVTPESCRPVGRDDVAVVPLVDAPPVTTVVAWPPDSRSPAVAALVRAAQALEL